MEIYAAENFPINDNAFPCLKTVLQKNIRIYTKIILFDHRSLSNVASVTKVRLYRLAIYKMQLWHTCVSMGEVGLSIFVTNPRPSNAAPMEGGLFICGVRGGVCDGCWPAGG